MAYARALLIGPMTTCTLSRSTNLRSLVRPGSTLVSGSSKISSILRPATSLLISLMWRRTPSLSSAPICARGPVVSCSTPILIGPNCCAIAGIAGSKTAASSMPTAPSQPLPLHPPQLGRLVAFPMASSFAGCAAASRENLCRTPQKARPECLTLYQKPDAASILPSPACWDITMLESSRACAGVWQGEAGGRELLGGEDHLAGGLRPAAGRFEGDGEDVNPLGARDGLHTEAAGPLPVHIECAGAEGLAAGDGPELVGLPGRRHRQGVGHEDPPGFRVPPHAAAGGRAGLEADQGHHLRLRGAKDGQEFP